MEICKDFITVLYHLTAWLGKGWSVYENWTIFLESQHNFWHVKLLVFNSVYYFEVWNFTSNFTLWLLNAYEHINSHHSSIGCCVCRTQYKVSWHNSHFKFLVILLDGKDKCFFSHYMFQYWYWFLCSSYAFFWLYKWIFERKYQALKM